MTMTRVTELEADPDCLLPRNSAVSYRTKILRFSDPCSMRKQMEQLCIITSRMLMLCPIARVGLAMVLVHTHSQLHPNALSLLFYEKALKTDHKNSLMFSINL